ncbi:TPA: hypothetical protein RQJ75_004430 [Vibrio vulnificus]|uniref:hypothetical protein n=1 Tax=Vibrio vulnificus TaxID=672 RepID=UPI001A2C7554|nr:hypothetical protein [Vibrio vulnificus]ELV8657353.1 hypothetical protein [Vibrio vulnificus]MCA3979731.1 hypothetical protein [Vibrio vulnificus]MCA4006476.1 hypothetical protein [Vibrio vulnificus]HAS6378064.1 hypothetical protein [Vibrio vulnificus]HDY7653431.1 hypothetical protein [Vibrio vulnificus]
MLIDVEEELTLCVQAIGGRHVSDLVGHSPKFQNADYIFPEQKVVAELKSLDEDKILDERNIKKASELYLKDLNNNKAPVVVFGTVQLTTAGFSEELVEGIKKLYKDPIQRLVKKANKQIRETKSELEVSNYKGLMLIANNNHSALDPDHANQILEEIFRKPDYSSINSVVYFSAGQTSVDSAGREFGIWIEKHREGLPQIESGFLCLLRDEWLQHYTKLKKENQHAVLKGNPEHLSNLTNKRNQ